ncbi:MAG: protein-tyrosine phosphatase family protein [Bacteroidota bacterium]
MRVYWIDNFTTGNVGMMARPKGNDWLEDEIQKLNFYNVDFVVSLLEWNEIQELGLEKEKYFCEQYNIQFIHLPIPDRNIPESNKNFIEFITHLNKALQNAKKIVIHCRMGIGRTSMVAAALLVSQSLKTKI